MLKFEINSFLANGNLLLVLAQTGQPVALSLAKGVTKNKEFRRNPKIVFNSLHFLLEQFLDHAATFGQGLVLLVAHDGKHGGRIVDDRISQKAVQVPAQRLKLFFFELIDCGWKTDSATSRTSFCRLDESTMKAMPLALFLYWSKNLPLTLSWPGMSMIFKVLCHKKKNLFDKHNFNVNC